MSFLLSHDSGRSLSLIDLPTEIHNKICAILPKTSLAALRLVSKDLMAPAERALFCYIHLETDWDKMQQFVELSNHDRLAKLVRHVIVEATSYHIRDREHWQSIIARTSRKGADSSKPKSINHRLATYKASLRAGEIEKCYQNFREIKISQDRLLLYTTPYEIYTELVHAFAQFPWLTKVTWFGSWAAKHVRKDVTTAKEPFNLRQTQRDILVTPADAVIDYDSEVESWVAVTLLAAIKSCATLGRIVLEGLSLEVFRLLANPCDLDASGRIEALSQPLSTLRHLSTSMFSRPPPQAEGDPDENSACLQSFGGLLKAAPSLEKVEFSPDTHFTVQRFVDLDPAMFIFKKLHQLDFDYSRVKAIDLQTLFIHTKNTLRVLILGHIHLKEGHWSDLFHCMREHLDLWKLDLLGGLYTDEGIWDLRLTDPRCEDLDHALDSKYLHTRVKAYILRLHDVRQLLPSTIEDAQEQWLAASDGKMRYWTWQQWYKHRINAVRVRLTTDAHGVVMESSVTPDVDGGDVVGDNAAGLLLAAPQSVDASSEPSTPDLHLDDRNIEDLILDHVQGPCPCKTCVDETERLVSMLFQVNEPNQT